MRKLVASAVVAGSMVAGGAAGVMLGIPGVSHAADSTVTVGAEGPAATTAATTATTAPAGPAVTKRAPVADAVDNALKGLVDNKTITQAQSDAVKAAIKDQLGNLPPRGPGGPGGPGRPGFPGKAIGAKADVLGSASKILGISPEDLATQLRNGTTLAEIAKSKNIDPQKIVDALVTDATAKIDQAVKDNKLTTEQGAKLKDGLKDRMTNVVNNAKPPHPHAEGRGFGGPPPGADDGPSTSSAPQPAGSTA